MNFKAIAGPIVQLAKLAGESLKSKITSFENELDANITGPFDALNSKVTAEKLQLCDQKQKLQIPYLITQECATRLDDLSKNIKLKERVEMR